jgi:hypothetical protein
MRRSTFQGICTAEAYGTSQSRDGHYWKVIKNIFRPDTPPDSFSFFPTLSSWESSLRSAANFDNGFEADSTSRHWPIAQLTRSCLPPDRPHCHSIVTLPSPAWSIREASGLHYIFDLAVEAPGDHRLVGNGCHQVRAISPRCCRRRLIVPQDQA